MLTYAYEYARITTLVCYNSNNAVGGTGGTSIYRYVSTMVPVLVQYGT